MIRHKIKQYLRRCLKRVYPELALVEQEQFRRMAGTIIDADSYVSPKAKINPPVSIEQQSSVGDYTYLAINAHLRMTSIGKFCSIGPNLLAGYGVHPLDGVSTSPMFYSTMRQNGRTLSSTDKIVEQKPIHIGNDVFIGANVTILDGVSIGDGAVIGAGAVVSKDIPPYAIAVGAPIKILRYRFPEDTICKLHNLQWWNMSEDKLPLVEQNFFDIDKFIAECEQCQNSPS